ncbi:MAG: Ldh family oxidoreductase [Bacteroidia bacterium]
MNSEIYFADPDKLLDFTRHIFLSAGFNDNKATIAATVLQRADLRGIDSHGVARLPGYVRLIKQGRILPDAETAIVHETPGTALADGNKGIGLVIAGEAMDIAIEKARAVGSGWVAVKNSSHFGVAVAHAEKALKHNMIGFVLTNASPLVSPAGGITPLFGTNPVCVTIPAGKFPPVIIDMSTTVAANGKLEIAQRKGGNIPEGWVQTREGLPSNNPDELKDGGTLLPLGGDLLHSSYKGYALGGWVDIFSGVLSGANFGQWVPPFVSFLDVHREEVGQGLGHFVGAWRIDAFRPVEDFKTSMDIWIEHIKKSKPAPGVERVLIPGEPEAAHEATRMAKGIPLHPKVVEGLSELSKEYKVELAI